MTQEFSSSSK